MKAMEHAEVYFNVRSPHTFRACKAVTMKSPQILCSVDPKQIPRLSPCDDEVYEKFRESFPDFNVAQVEETNLKSDKAKKVRKALPVACCVPRYSCVLRNGATSASCSSTWTTSVSRRCYAWTARASTARTTASLSPRSNFTL